MDKQQILEQMKGRSKRVRNRILLCVIGGVLLTLAALLALYLLLPEQESGGEKPIYFYPVSDVNIFESGEYHESDMIISYCSDPSGMGLTEEITAEDRASFDVGVQFLEVYLKTVISGDNETYRSFFAESYLKEHSLPTFTQQMLYRMCIYYCTSERLADGTERVTYRLDYMIRKNNGTFRNDVESDAIRPQYVVLLIDGEGNVKIENIYTTTNILK